MSSGSACSVIQGRAKDIKKAGRDLVPALNAAWKESQDASEYELRQEVIKALGVALPGEVPSNVSVSAAIAGGLEALSVRDLNVAVRDQGIDLPACATTFSPWVDLECTGESEVPGAVDDPMVATEALHDMANNYAAGDLRNPLASPLHANLSGLPPVENGL